MVSIDRNSKLLPLDKLRILNLAEDIAYRTNTTYSQDDRYKGYFEIMDDSTFYFDCSSFYSYIEREVNGI